MITVEKAKKLRAIIERAVAALELDNEAALECVELFPAWENGKAYTVETRVQYDGKLYRCVQAHTSQSDWTPPVAASLWSGVTVDPATGYDEWKQPTGAHDAYKKGDRVLFNGSVYESLIDGNAYSPTAYPAGVYTVELDGKIIARRESLLWVRLDAPGLYVVCTEAEGEGVIVDGEIYHVRGCPVLPGKQTVKLDYYEL